MTERSLPVAGFWRRYAAYAVDSLIMAIPSSVVLQPYDAWSDAFTRGLLARTADAAASQALAARLEIADILVGALLAQAVMALPAAVCLASRWQATPGKLLFRLCVSDPHLDRLGFRQALLRECLKVPSAAILGLGWLAAGWRGDRRAWHDLWADTYVMRYWPLQAMRHDVLS